MLRCNFCSDLARVECSQNRFCRNHRPEHDKTHEGAHLFKDVFCSISKEADADFRNAISSRLTTLKKCKNAFTQATAEYIKNIQGMLIEKIAEIDRQYQFYIHLVEKPYFDRDDSVEIDKILSTRLEIKNLEQFTDSAFKKFIQQSIIESKKSSLLTNEGVFLIDILRLCSPSKIPERMLKEIMVSSHEKNDWFKAKDELVKYQLVSIDENSKFWWIFQSRLSDLRDGGVLVKVSEECLKFCARFFLIDEDIIINSKEGKRMLEIMPHVEKIMDSNKIKNDNEVTTIINLARAYIFLEYNKTRAEKYIESLIQTSKSKKNNKQYAAQILFTVGQLYFYLKNYEQAELFYLKCLKIQEQILPDYHPDQVTLYMNLGNLYNSKANDDKAADFYFKCLNILNQNRTMNYPHQASLYLYVGHFFNNRTDYDMAENFYFTCLTIIDKSFPENHPKQAELNLNLGILCYDKEDYNGAETYLLKSLKIHSQIMPENHPDKISLYMNLGKLYQSIADYDKAEKFYLEYLKIQAQILPESKSDRANICMKLGNLYQSKAEYDKAESFYLQCLMIQDGFFPENHPHFANLYMNLGNLYKKKTDYDKAENFYLKCLKICEKILPGKHPDRESLYMNLGNLYTNKAEYDKAEEFYLKCYKIQEQILPENHLKDLKFKFL